MSSHQRLGPREPFRLGHFHRPYRTRWQRLRDFLHLRRRRALVAGSFRGPGEYALRPPTPVERDDAEGRQRDDG